MRIIAQQRHGLVSVSQNYMSLIFSIYQHLHCLEIVFNSLSSVLSYNNFDFEPIFTKKDKKSKAQKKVRHEPTVVKQTIYFLIMTSLNLGYGNSHILGNLKETSFNAG